MDPIADRLKIIRAKKGLSQEDFAKSLGYSKGYIADIETGRAKPSRRLLETIQKEFGVSIDWLLSENQILDIIEENKKSPNPSLIFIYAFTREGIDETEKTIRDSLKNRNYILVDASNLTENQLLKEILTTEGQSEGLFRKLNDRLMDEETILILKNISLSKIPKASGWIRSIFKSLDDAWLGPLPYRKAVKKNRPNYTLERGLARSSLIVLDFASYLEKNMEVFGYYVIPVYLLRSQFEWTGWVK